MGDGAFAEGIEYLTGTEPSAIVTADFNGDGWVDLAVANEMDDTVWIWWGLGSGAFEGPSSVPVGLRPSSLASADLNGDGRPDLLTINRLGGSLSVLLGTADGTFDVSERALGLAEISGRLTLGDFTGEGFLDVVLLGFPNNWVHFLRGNGDGTFQDPTTVFVGSQPVLTAAADFNKDGRLDLAVIGFDGFILEIKPGNGDGTFGSLGNTDLSGRTVFLLPLDFNRDGQADVGIVNESHASLQILLGNGDGTFGGSLSVGLPASEFVSRAVAADFNGDGKRDVAATQHTGSTSGFVAVRLGQGDGSFQNAPNTAMDAAGVVDVGVGDFDGNGKPDLVALPANTGRISVYLGNGDGTFQTPVSAAPPSGAVPQRIAVGDFNGDGKSDLAVTLFDFNTSQDKLEIHLGNGNGTFQAGGSFTLEAWGVPSVTVADFNLDSKLDIAVTVQFGVLVFRGNGDGTFQPPTTLETGVLSTNVLVAADFNQDGKVDLAVGTSQGVSVFLGNGDGTFQPRMDKALSFSPEMITAGDLSGDGIPDVVVTQVGPAAFVLVSEGNGNFRPPVALGRGYDAALGDFNSDGVGDAVLVTTASFPDQQALTLLLSRPTVGLFPAALDFGEQAVGTSSDTRPVELTNAGNGVLTLTSLATTGDFMRTHVCETTLAPGTGCQISVVFSPTAPGQRSGSLTLANNSSTSPQTISLRGVGTSSTADFSVSAEPASVSIAPGQNASFTLTITPVSGFNQAVTLSCSGAPSGATCSVEPATVTPDGVNPVSATVTVRTTAPSSFSPRERPGPSRPDFLWISLFGTLVFAVFASFARRATPGWTATSLAVLLLLSLAVAGCGGSSTNVRNPGNPGTPTGTYTLTLSGTSGSLTRSTTVSLVVR
jgi:hypothetical protein